MTIHRRRPRAFIVALAAVAAAAVGIAIAPVASSAPGIEARKPQPRAYQYGNWSQPGSGFTTGSDDTTSQVYQLTWRQAFPDLDDTPGPIYVAGSFIKSGATTINRVGRWDDTTSSWVPLQGDDTGIAPTVGLGGVTDGAPTPGVYGMVLGGDDSLYVGGEFAASDSTLNNVGQWNGSDWVSMGYGLGAALPGNTPVQDMVVGNDFIGGDDRNYADDTIYALGNFDICTNASCTTATVGRGIAQFSQATRTWSNANSSLSGSGALPFAGAYLDDTLYVGGTFTAVSGVSGTTKIAQRSAGGTWSPVGLGLNNGVFSMAVHPITKDLYVGGTFTAATGGAANSLVGVAKWDYEDDTWYAVGTGMTSPNVDDISFSADGKTMWIGNWDTAPTVGGTVANGVAMLTSEDLDDTAATTVSGSWNYLKSAGVIGVSGPAAPTGGPNQKSVRATLALPTGSVMYGGNFHTAGAVSAGRVATFTPGAEPSPYDPVYPPGVPTDVVATSGWNKVTVDWKAPTYAGSYPITNYLVTSTPGNKYCISTLQDAKLTQCTFTDLTPGTRYTFTVQGLNGGGWGDRSASSNAASPLNLKINSYSRKKLNFFLGGGSEVKASGIAPGYAAGTKVIPWTKIGDAAWIAATSSSLAVDANARFSWSRKFAKGQNGKPISVKFEIAGSFSNTVVIPGVR